MIQFYPDMDAICRENIEFQIDAAFIGTIFNLQHSLGEDPTELGNLKDLITLSQDAEDLCKTIGFQLVDPEDGLLVKVEKTGQVLYQLVEDPSFAGSHQVKFEFFFTDNTSAILSEIDLAIEIKDNQSPEPVEELSEEEEEIIDDEEIAYEQQDVVEILDRLEALVLDTSTGADEKIIEPTEIANIKPYQVTQIINGKLSGLSDRKKQDALGIIMLARKVSLEKSTPKENRPKKPELAFSPVENVAKFSVLFNANLAGLDFTEALNV